MSYHTSGGHHPPPPRNHDIGDDAIKVLIFSTPNRPVNSFQQSIIASTETTTSNLPQSNFTKNSVDYDTSVDFYSCSNPNFNINCHINGNITPKESFHASSSSSTSPASSTLNKQSPLSRTQALHTNLHNVTHPTLNTNMQHVYAQNLLLHPNSFHYLCEALSAQSYSVDELIVHGDTSCSPVPVANHSHPEALSTVKHPMTNQRLMIITMIAMLGFNPTAGNIGHITPEVASATAPNGATAHQSLTLLFPPSFRHLLFNNIPMAGANLNLDSTSLGATPLPSSSVQPATPTPTSSLGRLFDLISSRSSTTNSTTHSHHTDHSPTRLSSTRSFISRICPSLSNRHHTHSPRITGTSMQTPSTPQTTDPQPSWMRLFLAQLQSQPTEPTSNTNIFYSAQELQQYNAQLTLQNYARTAQQQHIASAYHTPADYFGENLGVNYVENRDNNSSMNDGSDNDGESISSTTNNPHPKYSNATENHKKVQHKPAPSSLLTQHPTLLTALPKTAMLLPMHTDRRNAMLTAFQQKQNTAMLLLEPYFARLFSGRPSTLERSDGNAPVTPKKLPPRLTRSQQSYEQRVMLFKKRKEAILAHLLPWSTLLQQSIHELGTHENNNDIFSNTGSFNGNQSQFSNPGSVVSNTVTLNSIQSTQFVESMKSLTITTNTRETNKKQLIFFSAESHQFEHDNDVNAWKDLFGKSTSHADTENQSEPESVMNNTTNIPPNAKKSENVTQQRNTTLTSTRSLRTQMPARSVGNLFSNNPSTVTTIGRHHVDQNPLRPQHLHNSASASNTPTYRPANPQRHHNEHILSPLNEDRLSLSTRRRGERLENTLFLPQNNSLDPINDHNAPHDHDHNAFLSQLDEEYKDQNYDRDEYDDDIEVGARYGLKNCKTIHHQHNLTTESLMSDDNNNNNSNASHHNLHHHTHPPSQAELDEQEYNEIHCIDLPKPEQIDQVYHHTNALGCQHYERGCSISATCCQRYYSCRYCHDLCEDHNIIRKNINNIVCNYCLLDLLENELVLCMSFNLLQYPMKVLFSNVLINPNNTNASSTPFSHQNQHHHPHNSQQYQDDNNLGTKLHTIMSNLNTAMFFEGDLIAVIAEKLSSGVARAHQLYTTGGNSAHQNNNPNTTNVNTLSPLSQIQGENNLILTPSSTKSYLNTNTTLNNIVEKNHKQIHYMMKNHVAVPINKQTITSITDVLNNSSTSTTPPVQVIPHNTDEIISMTGDHSTTPSNYFNHIDPTNAHHYTATPTTPHAQHSTTTSTSTTPTTTQQTNSKEDELELQQYYDNIAILQSRISSALNLIQISLKYCSLLPGATHNSSIFNQQLLNKNQIINGKNTTTDGDNTMMVPDNDDSEESAYDESDEQSNDSESDGETHHEHHLEDNNSNRKNKKPKKQKRIAPLPPSTSNFLKTQPMASVNGYDDNLLLNLSSFCSLRIQYYWMISLLCFQPTMHLIQDIKLYCELLLSPQYKPKLLQSHQHPNNINNPLVTPHQPKLNEIHAFLHEQHIVLNQLYELVHHIDVNLLQLYAIRMSSKLSAFDADLYKQVPQTDITNFDNNTNNSTTNIKSTTIFDFVKTIKENSTTTNIRRPNMQVFSPSNHSDY